MRAIDTNVLVRLLVRDDEAQAESAEAFIERGAWISHHVLAETLSVLDAVYERTPAQLALAVEMLLDHQSLSLQDGDTVRAALSQFRAHPKLGFSDCLVLEIAGQAGHLPLGSFDRKLSRLDGAQRV